jgi:hypothetical protein
MDDDGPPLGCIVAILLFILTAVFWAVTVFVFYQWLFGLGPFVRGTV